MKLPSAAAAALAAATILVSPGPLAATTTPTIATEVPRLLEASYLDRDALAGTEYANDVAELAASPPSEQLESARNLVRHLGDRYSKVLSPRDARKISAKYDGAAALAPTVGADGVLRVGAAATAAAPGEPISTLNGVRIRRGVTMDEVYAAVAQGDDATIRADVGGRAVEVARRTSAADPARRLATNLVGSTGIVRLGEFRADSGAAVADALASLRAAGAERVVLDLRGNGGGAFSAVLSVAGSLLPPAPAGAAPPLVALTREARGPAIPHVAAAAQAYDGPLEVWTDWQTASASEVLVGALQDHCRARVVGAGRTYGKGVGQRLYGLPGGGALVATFERTLTPAGREIDGVGLAPDATRLFASSVLGDLALPLDAAFVGAATPACAAPPAPFPQLKDAAPPWHAQRAPAWAGRSSAAVAGGYGVAVGGAAWAGRRWRGRGS